MLQKANKKAEPVEEYIASQLATSTLTATTPQSEINPLNDSTDSLEAKQLVAPSFPAPTCGAEFRPEDIVFSIEAYSDHAGDGISFTQGQKFKVLKRDFSNGWWYVQTEDNKQEGWAPSTFLAVSIAHI